MTVQAVDYHSNRADDLHSVLSKQSFANASNLSDRPFNTRDAKHMRAPIIQEQDFDYDAVVRQKLTGSLIATQGVSQVLHSRANTQGSDKSLLEYK